MKKFFITISLITILCLIFVSCNNVPIDTDTNVSTNSENGTTLDPDENTIDTSIQVQHDADREEKDNEFPFDNIIVERKGYDIVAAGKYYGNDFDNVKYYGSYYRIIDNYDDFSELTQWGNKINESIFSENFVLVLHTYKKQYIYYSYLNEKGNYDMFVFETSSDKLKIREWWVCSATNDAIIDSNGNIIERPRNELYTNVFPTDVRETIYLLIPKNELPKDISINGDIDLERVVEKLE